jgi:acetylornithine/N-succinyldiaminopimelate aminotransferase
MIPALLPVYDRVDVDFSHGIGAYLFDLKGNKYLDFSSGYAALALGHCHPRMVESLTTQANKLWHTSSKYKVIGLAEYCKRITEISFADTLFVANSGAEAVECMIKMARRYFNAKGKLNKYRIITFEGAFHGRTIGCISAAAEDKIRGFEPALDGFNHIKWNDLDAVKAAITEDTAGIMIEPIQGEGGMRECSEEFMKGLRSLCDKHDILLMLDEVQCGMGRTGYMFAHEMYGVRPDIITLGKGLGSGFPISACLTTEAVGKCMFVGSHGSTFGGNPLAVAIGHTVLDVILEPGFLDNVKKISAYLRGRLEELAEKYPNIIDRITGKGLMLGINLKAQYDAEIASKVCFDEHLLSMSASNNVLRITPPLIINQAHCDEAFEKLDRVMQKLSRPGTTLIGKLKNMVGKFKNKLGIE